MAIRWLLLFAIVVTYRQQHSIIHLGCRHHSGTPACIMRGPLCLFCLCQGGSAAHQGIAGGQDAEGPPSLLWEWMAVCSAMVVALVLAFATKLLTGKWSPKGRRTSKQPDALADSDELKSRLLQTFSQMEKELVKLMTLVRNHKASLITRHRGCKSPACLRVRENNKAFNLAVYDIVEE